RLRAPRVMWLVLFAALWMVTISLAPPSLLALGFLFLFTLGVFACLVATHLMPIPKSIGASSEIAPFHIVASQLNTFTPVGTAISIVAYMKKSIPAVGNPVVNM